MKHLATLLLFAGFTSLCLGQAPCDSLLQASFTPQHLEGNSYVFNNTSSSDSPTSTVYSWAFGDGSSQNDLTGAHTYAQAGSYTVCLYATLGSCVDTMCQELQVGGSGPECNAEFQFTALEQNADSVHFSPDQTDADHYLWHFGDGGTTDHHDPWHLYAEPGTYVTCLTVTNELNGQSCTDTWCDTVVVVGDAGPECNAEFQFTALEQNADSVHFSPDQTNADHYLWHFGDGSTSDHHDPWHLYAEPGTYVTCLTVTNELNGQSCTDTWCDTVVVVGDAGPECNAEFQFTALEQNADSVHFSPDQTNADHYLWHFGDGGTTDHHDPWHLYAEPGTYVTCLTVTNELNGQSCTDTWCDTVVVVGDAGPECNAEFQFTALEQNADSVHFSPDQTDADHYLWHFGDGSTSDHHDPWHLYAEPGTYVTCLTVTNELNGQSCTDTWCDTVVVVGDAGPECNAEFQFTALEQNADSVHFSPEQTNADHYLWHFGDGSTSDHHDPWHLYAEPGTYVTCLTVTNELNGQSCTDTWCDTVMGGAAEVVAGIARISPIGTLYSWPQPFEDELHLSGEGIALVERAMLFDQVGRLLDDRKVNASSGVLVLNYASLPTGIYVLRLRGALIDRSVRLMKR